jgi:hypothetical protein
LLRIFSARSRANARSLAGDDPEKAAPVARQVLQSSHEKPRLNSQFGIGMEPMIGIEPTASTLVNFSQWRIESILFPLSRTSSLQNTQ